MAVTVVEADDADVTLVASTSSAADHDMDSSTADDTTTTAVASPSISAADASAANVASPSTSTAATTSISDATRKRKRRKQPPVVLVDVGTASDAAAPSTSSTVASGKRKCQPINVADVAAQEEPSKAERGQLFAECRRQFGATALVTRSRLQEWQPNISDGNIAYLLMRRNVESANKMLVSMHESSKRRQQSILDSFAKK